MTCTTERLLVEEPHALFLDTSADRWRGNVQRTPQDRRLERILPRTKLHILLTKLLCGKRVKRIQKRIRLVVYPKVHRTVFASHTDSIHDNGLAVKKMWTQKHTEGFQALCPFVLTIDEKCVILGVRQKLE